MSGISLSPVVASLSSTSLTPEAGSDSQPFDFANVLGQVMSPVVDTSQLLTVAPTLIDRSDGKSVADDAQTEQASLPGAASDAYTQLMMAMAQLASSQHDFDRPTPSSGGGSDAMDARANLKKMLGLNAHAGESARRGLVEAASDRDMLTASGEDGGKLAEVGANFAALLQDLPQSGDGVSAKPLASVATEKAASVEQSMPVMGHAGVVEVRQQEGRKELVIDTPVGRPGWGDELGAKVVVVVRDGQQSAEMQLNPPNLGPLEVRLSVQNDQTTLMFVSAHASVREAIQAALPRLSGMFAESGLSMGSVTVGDQSLAQQQQQQQNDQNSKRSYSSSSVADVDLGAGVAEPMVLTRSAWRLSMFV